MRLSIPSLSLTVFIFFVSSCKKDDATSIPEINHEVYVGGWSNPSDNTTNGAFYGKIWINGSEQQLSTANESRVFDIYRSANDLYSVGYAVQQNMTAVYWKNGVLNVLPNDVNGIPVECAHAIYVNNTNIYIAGGPFYGGSSGTLWINGITEPLPNCIDAKDVIVSNDDVYVAGSTEGLFGSVAAYWINDSIIPVGDLFSSINTEANSIAVLGNDIYVAGNNRYIYNSNYVTNAILWKNNQQVFLPNLGDNSEAISVATAGADVYVLVREENQTTGYTVGAVYKNGARLYSLNNGFPTALTIKDGSIYVSGFCEDGSEPKTVAVYWKNGNQFKLTDGVQYNNIASSIFVR